MKKKIFAGIMVLALAMASVIGVSAAGSTSSSPSVDESQKGDAQKKGYEIKTGSDEFSELTSEKQKTVKAAIQEFNKSSDKSLDTLLAAGGVKVNDDVKTELAGKTLLGNIFDLAPVGGGTPDASGHHHVTVVIPALTDKVVDGTIRILHFNHASDTWEVLKAETVDLAAKKIKAEYPSLSPVAVFAQVAADQAPAGTSPATGVSTGVPAAWMVLSALGLIVLGGGIVAIYRKRQ